MPGKSSGGRIMQRNSCRNSWLGALNARLTTTLLLVRGQYIQIVADIANVAKPDRAAVGTIP